MPNILPINIRNLLYARGVESARLEFKASWEPEVMGIQVLHTICAFANDLQNLNGGYIIIGVAEQDGVALMPPQGLLPSQLDAAQKWIRGQCNRLDPAYQPVMSPEVIDGQSILVLWVPASDVRPHQAPESSNSAIRKFYIRLGSETVEAKGELLTELIQLAAKVPFDDRQAHNVPLEAIREARVREFLSDVGSGLVQEKEAREVYRRMRISARVNSHDAPRNIGLLFFSEDPEEWFPGARIEVVEFAGDSSGNVIEERVFRGPLHYQLRNCLAYLRTFSTQHLEKLENRPEIKGWVSFPFPAMEEALVNAVYHRGYDSTYEPIKVYLYPDRMEITSYPGPVRSIEHKHLLPGSSIPPISNRNRRIGELLKELRLAEGRGTGIPKVYRAMSQNASPPPIFDFDEDRTYFRVVLPAHPEYVAIAALRDAAHLRAIGDNASAIERVKLAFGEHSASETLAVSLIDELSAAGQLDEARDIYSAFMARAKEPQGVRVLMAISHALFNAGMDDEARAILDKVPLMLPAADACEAAILERRASRQKKAHQYFEKAGDFVYHDARALHEFAQTKINLSGELLPRQRNLSPFQKDARQRLLREAREMLQRVVQMDAPPTRRAWAWYDLGRVLRGLEAPAADIRAAFQAACEILPDEERFRTELN